MLSGVKINLNNFAFEFTR